MIITISLKTNPVTNTFPQNFEVKKRMIYCVEYWS